MQAVLHSSGAPSQQRVEFMGTSLADAKRKALNYWYLNRDLLRLSVREFSERLVLMGDGKTILYTHGAKGPH
jgi:hypothetical protein